MKLNYNETKSGGPNWLILGGIAVLIAAAAVFFATRPANPEKIKGKVLKEFAALEKAKKGNNFMQIIAFPDQTSAKLSKKDQNKLIENTFMQAVITPAPLKVGQKSELTYKLYSRFTTNYDGPVAPANFGTMKAEFVPIKDFKAEKVKFLKKDTTEAVVAKVAFTPTKAGEQVINFGAFKITIIDKKNNTGLAAAIVFPSVKLNVQK